MKRKVTVEQALALIAAKYQARASESVPVTQAFGRRLADDLFAPIELPPFNNSAVDGYALGSLARDFNVVGTVAAGDNFSGTLQPDQACRIMTGALLPKGTKAIAMQEHVRTDGNRIQVESTPLEHDHVRFAGEDVDVGALVARKGTRIATKHIGLLSALGMGEICVEKNPRIAIVSTGSELVDPGDPLLDGQVYYCTGPMLRAQAERAGASVLSVQKIRDDEQEIIEGLKKARAADIIITVGGMADGEFDFGRSALSAIGVEPVFFEGMWRPGKPLFFGTHGEKLIFGLPGNPVAAFVMFRIFVEAAVSQLPARWNYASIVGAKPKTSDKAQFLRARKMRDGLELVPGQGSHQLFNLAQSDAIVWVPDGESTTQEYRYLELES